MRYVLDADLEVKDAVLKPEMLEYSSVNGDKNKNTDIEQKKQRRCCKNYSQNEIAYYQTKIRSCKCYLMNASVS